MSALFANLLHFSELLRALGLDVPAAATIDVAAALAHVDIGRRLDFYFTLQSLLVRRHQDLAVFDEAFRMFWRRPTAEWTPRDLRAMGERRRTAASRRGPASAPPAGGPGPADARGEPLATVDRVAPFSYSHRETLREKDFSTLTGEEAREAKAMLASLRWEPDARRTRRWMAAAGAVPDLRRLAGRAVRYGGEPVDIPRRERRWRPRPLVLLCDVSGSMERYSRMLLHFAHGLASRAGRFEAFLFATRLTRITRDISRRGADDAVSRVLKATPDWGGGTRIGDAVRTYNVEWARRVGGRGPVVLLISDGWDRGDPDRLAGEMARLARASHRLIWLNPLLGSPEYQPLTRGMRAALPYVDDFLPVHNLVSLERLADYLNALPPSRGGSRRTGPTSCATPNRAGAGRRGRSGRRPVPARPR